MAVQWTNKQRQVIDTKGKEILVSAAAGSGKTAVLVERIIEGVLDKQSPLQLDRLLVVTFTDAAAGEMRERILDALTKAAEEDGSNEYLQRQLCLVHNARITTIHKFCLLVIRDYFDRTSLDPGFRVGDEGELKLIRSDVIMQMLEEYYEDGKEEFLAFMDNYGNARSDKNIEDLILKVYSVAYSHPFPNDWLNQCEEAYEHTDEIEQQPWMRYIIEKTKRLFEEWKKQYQKAVVFCNDEDGPQKYLPVMEQELGIIDGCLHAKEYNSLRKIILSYQPARMPAVKKGTVNEEKQEYIKSLRERFKKKMNGLATDYFAKELTEIAKELENGKENIKILNRLVTDFSLRYQKMKQDKGLIDFSDMEHLALSILVEKNEKGELMPTEAALSLSAQFDEIMIDEYQDSNRVQETILRSVSTERDGKPNLFMVGDVKQSIYKFRMANPELFMEKSETYPELISAGKDARYVKITMDRNFRSRLCILDTVNFVFQRIMKKEVGNIIYDDTQALYPGADFPDIPDTQSNVTEVMLVETEKDETEGEGTEGNLYQSTMEIEARACGLKIKELTDKEHGMMVLDKKTREYRRATYRDIAILFRTHSNWGEAYERVLNSMGLPAICEVDTGYFDTMEVGTILSLLRVIENPLQDIEFVSVLKAPFFGVTDTELAQIQAAQKHLDGAWFYEKVKDYSETKENALAVKLKAIIEKILSYRKKAVYTSVYELLEYILEDTGYYDYVLSMPAGKKRAANLDLLKQKAVDYQSISYTGLFDFVRYIEKIKKVDLDFGEAKTVSEQDNILRIMSIHKSKGLEYPIVIIGGMNKKFNQQDASSSVVIEQDFGIGLDYRDPENKIQEPTFYQKAVSDKIKTETIGEELRILYVGMTRAKEKLILIGSTKNIEDYEKKLPQCMADGSLSFETIEGSTNYMDWILCCQKQAKSSLMKLEKVSLESLLLDTIEKQVLRETKKENFLHFDASRVYCEDYKKQIKEQMEYQYAYQMDCSIPIKASVSDLKQAHMDEAEKTNQMFFTEDKEMIPKFLSNEEEKSRKEKLNGAARGTMYHHIFEKVDLTELVDTKNVQKVLSDMVEKGELEEAYLEQIEPSILLQFARSDLGKRMKHAEEQGTLYKERQFFVGLPAREVFLEHPSDELVMIQGVIDVYFMEDGEYVIADYKTDRVRDMDTLVDRYALQLDLYERALRQMTGCRVKEKIIYSTALGKEYVMKGMKEPL